MLLRCEFAIEEGKWPWLGVLRLHDMYDKWEGRVWIYLCEVPRYVYSETS